MHKGIGSKIRWPATNLFSNKQTKPCQLQNVMTMTTYMDLLLFLLGELTQVLKVVTLQRPRPNVVERENEDDLDVVRHIRNERKQLPLTGRTRVHI